MKVGDLVRHTNNYFAIKPYGDNKLGIIVGYEHIPTNGITYKAFKVMWSLGFIDTVYEYDLEVIK